MYYFLTKGVIPQNGAYASALVEPVVIIVIMLAGIVMMLGAVGMKVSNNLGATIANGIFQAIGYVVRIIIQAIGWIIRNTLRLLPRVFRESRRTFTQMGLNAGLSNLFAVLVTAVVLVIII